MISFNVIDSKTGEYPDLEHIARAEEWAQNLIPCDMEGFCINEDGNLLLMDECGNYAYFHGNQNVNGCSLLGVFSLIGNFVGINAYSGDENKMQSFKEELEKIKC